MSEDDYPLYERLADAAKTMHGELVLGIGRPHFTLPQSVAGHWQTSMAEIEKALRTLAEVAQWEQDEIRRQERFLKDIERQIASNRAMRESK